MVSARTTRLSQLGSRWSAETWFIPEQNGRPPFTYPDNHTARQEDPYEPPTFRIMVALDDGALVQTLMVGRDGVIGASQALDNKTSIDKTIVQVPGAAAMIDRSPLRDLMEQHPAIRNLLATHEQFLVADIQQTAACNARHSVEARTARWILRMQDLVGDEFILTQEHLAAMIGVRRAAVTGVAD